jgi:transcriptional regulator with XRE-family HTH domain
MSLGKQIKAARTKAALSLRAIEKLTGISAAKLSKVENGIATLRYPELIGISECLKIPVTALMSDESKDSRPSGRRAITKVGMGHKFEKTNKVYEVLCGDMTHYENHYWRVVIRDVAPGSADSYSSHPGEEFIFVLKGVLHLYTELYKPLELKAGESIVFDADTPHAYFASGGAEVEILLVNSVPRENAK